MCDMRLENKIIITLSYALIILAVSGYFIFPFLSPLSFLALAVDAVVMTLLFGSCRD